MHRLTADLMRGFRGGSGRTLMQLPAGTASPPQGRRWPLPAGAPAARGWMREGQGTLPGSCSRKHAAARHDVFAMNRSGWCQLLIPAIPSATMECMLKRLGTHGTHAPGGGHPCPSRSCNKRSESLEEASRSPATCCHHSVSDVMLLPQPGWPCCHMLCPSLTVCHPCGTKEVGRWV
jgi:hypothetical protein